MAKFTFRQKMAPEEREGLLIAFFKGLACVKNSKEAAQVLSDLLTEQELDMLSKRLAIARALLRGDNYQEIVIRLKVSMGTIARVSSWLQESGEGFRLIISRLKPESVPHRSSPADPITQFKRKYPQYFWPQQVLERVVIAANKREREQLKALIKKTRKKTLLMRRLDFLLAVSKQNYHTT